MKRKVGQLLREYHLKDVTSGSLISALNQQGFTVLFFNRLHNDEDLSCLIHALRLRTYIASSKGFTYADADRRLVFIHEELSEKEKAMVLAHEQGHIFCGHTEKQPILGEDVRQENEANEFAHHLLHPSIWQRIQMWVRRHKALAAVLASLCALLIVGSIMLACILHENQFEGEYYLTATGTHYHTADCGFVKDKPNTRRMTKEEYASGLFEPCTRCLAEE